MQKISIVPGFPHEILQFQESGKLIDQEHIGTKLKNRSFARYGVCAETLITK